jgi:hypothetical protein
MAPIVTFEATRVAATDRTGAEHPVWILIPSREFANDLVGTEAMGACFAALEKDPQYDTCAYMASPCLVLSVRADGRIRMQLHPTSCSDTTPQARAWTLSDSHESSTVEPLRLPMP